ncbi:gluconokinase [Nocardia sp. NPDC005366]|uniref:gluconokinase n=1 Tax=Nocardia sp. NPDC005366 TaxID=3156878 RepID=UPI0033B4807C
MGVSGAGKSTVGARLAAALDVDYADGDDFHPAANIEKMTAGIALTTDDRAPWLDAIATWLADHRKPGGVVSCSALERGYRDRLRKAVARAFFVHLDADRDELDRRMSARRGHFMPTALLDSQLDALQPLAADENGVTVDATRAPGELVRTVIAVVRDPKAAGR